MVTVLDPLLRKIRLRVATADLAKARWWAVMTIDAADGKLALLAWDDRTLALQPAVSNIISPWLLAMMLKASGWSYEFAVKAERFEEI